MSQTSNEVVLALDIGATKFAAGLVTETGDVLHRAQTFVDHGASAEGTFDELVALARDALDVAAARQAQVQGCGVGAAGPITRNVESVSPLNLVSWREFPLRERLQDVLGLEVYGDVDTKALALGEGWLGAAVGQRDYLAMVVSTGIGGGVVLDGSLLEGASGNAGHVGHVIVVPDGRECGCGGVGCVEAEASGTAIEAITGRPPAEASPAIIERTGRLVGRALASVMNVLELPIAYVAGSIAFGFGEPFFAAAQAELDASVHLAGGLHGLIEPAGLGPDAPLIGAGSVGWRGLGRLR